MTTQAEPLSEEEIGKIAELLNQRKKTWLHAVKSHECSPKPCGHVSHGEAGRVKRMFDLLSEEMIEGLLATITTQAAKIAELETAKSICYGTREDLLDGKLLPGNWHDGTDGACPGWWRGRFTGVSGAVERLKKVFDSGEQEGVFGHGGMNKLAADILELQAENNRRRGVHEESEWAGADYMGQRDRLRKALEKYGKHTIECKRDYVTAGGSEDAVTCTCGLDAALKKE